MAPQYPTRTRAQPGDETKHFVLTKWLIVVILSVSSVPAGALPMFALGAHRGIQAEQNRNEKWRNERKIESGRHVRRIFLIGAAITSIAHLALVSLAAKNWNGTLWGLRGAVWLALLWSAFGVGLGSGFGIYSVAPE